MAATINTPTVGVNTRKNHNIWIKTKDGEEVLATLPNIHLPVRTGQSVALVQGSYEGDTVLPNPMNLFLLNMSEKNHYTLMPSDVIMAYFDKGIIKMGKQSFYYGRVFMYAVIRYLIERFLEGNFAMFQYTAANIHRHEMSHNPYAISILITLAIIVYRSVMFFIRTGMMKRSFAAQYNDVLSSAYEKLRN